MASYNEYHNPYAQPQAQYGAREGEDFSTPSYAHQPADYNSYGDVTPVSGEGQTATAASSFSAKGVGAEKPHPDDIDGVNQLGEIGGTERSKPGRAGLHHPTSSFAAMGPPPRSTGILRMWRKDERGKQWFRGGGGRGTARLACCCLTITVLMIISIVLTVLMYVRPPSITFNGVEVEPGSVKLDEANKKFHVAVKLNISVTNPNWFDANFKRIEADVKYASGNFGGGVLNKVNLAAYRRSTFMFPFYLNYSSSADPDQKMIMALADSCGVTGSSNRQMTVGYNLRLWLSILSATVSPSIDSTATLDCPLEPADIEKLMGSA